MPNSQFSKNSNLMSNNETLTKRQQTSIDQKKEPNSIIDFVHSFHLTLLNLDYDINGNPYWLYSGEKIEYGAYLEEIVTLIRFVAVICPSTGQEHIIVVPDHIQSAREGVAWSFGKKVEDYHPIVET